MVLDTAGQKGTGKWTSVNALDMGVPAPTVAEAVFARCICAVKEERVGRLEDSHRARREASTATEEAFVAAIRDALYCSKICSYAQGFQLMRAAQREYNWKLNFGEIAQIWRGGCIIRARFLQKITEAYAARCRTSRTCCSTRISTARSSARQANWRKVDRRGGGARRVRCRRSARRSPTTTATARARLPANLLQAQRDYFGAHTYERVDQPRGKFFHLDWPAAGPPAIRRCSRVDSVNQNAMACIQQQRPWHSQPLLQDAFGASKPPFVKSRE